MARALAWSFLPAIRPSLTDSEDGFERRENEMWANLPDLLLEEIFSSLTMRQRYYASMVCTNWYRVSQSPRCWGTMIMKDRVLTRRKFNYYLGYEHVLDHYRVQICLHRVGRFMRRIIIYPMSNFSNLYEFMNMFSYFSEFFDDNPLGNVHTFHYTFQCHLAERTGELVFGTGGMMLGSLKRLMTNLKGLRNIALNDLLLEKNDAIHLLDDIVLNCGQTIKTLRLINCTRVPCPILHVGVFLNVREMTISPQQLNEDVIGLLSHTALENLYIVQNAYTDQAQGVTPSAWLECRKVSPRLRVHLRTEGPVRREVIWQESAPVRSISYLSPYMQITTQSMLTIVELYRNDLEVYGHHCLPRFYMTKSFHDRADSSLVLLCRQCPRLHTLVIRQLISSATVLLLAWTGQCLQRLYVRRNAIIKRADWPCSPDWSGDFYEWLRRTSRDYKLMEQEISRLLGVSWRPLEDKEFKMLNLQFVTSPPEPIDLNARRRSNLAMFKAPPTIENKDNMFHF